MHPLSGTQRAFTGVNLSEISFPLGGIGTGTISLGGRGDLRDFEIKNHPDKGASIPFTFFALWAKAAGKPPVAKVLERRPLPPFREAGGESPDMAVGLPRFRHVSFTGEYPVAAVELEDEEMPLRASLRAWNPFIPLNVQDSAIPTAIFEWTFMNDSDSPVEISFASSMGNTLKALKETGELTEEGTRNDAFQSGFVQGIFYHHPAAKPEHQSTGTVALSTTWEDVKVHPQWYRGGWFDRTHLFWDNFSATGEPLTCSYDDGTPRFGDIGSLIMKATVPPRGSVTIPVAITWHFPRMANPWTDDAPDVPTVLETYVSGRYCDAAAVAEYVFRHLPRLTQETDAWREAIFQSTLPREVLEAISSQAAIMRTTTCFLLADSRFFGWEGTWPHQGSCHGSCTHVWNYEQAVAFLFPELERTMRRTEFLHNTRESGNMAFRTNLPPGYQLWNFKPCVDGQMGAIMQVYRDWQLSGDEAFLRELWPGVKRALEYAWTMTPEKMEPPSGKSTASPMQIPGSIDSLWDSDKDGVMEGEQHNTYDIEFYGPNPLCTVMYLGALKACAAMAEALGKPDKAEEYRAVYQSGKARVERELWNGEYYIQKVEVIDGVEIEERLRTPSEFQESPLDPEADSPPVRAEDQFAPKYQFGVGCLSDQLLGQLSAHVAGLGYLLDANQVRSAVESIYRYNYRPRIGALANVQRVYAVNDEPGLVLCSWPAGNRPALPFAYCDEVWTGIEYQVAAHLIYEGWIDEGLTIVQAVAERYSGYNRNPWNQIECGNHYARAMASWSVKLALDGFTYSLPEKRLGFAPKINAADFRTFWSTGTGWGTYRQNLAERRIILAVTQGEQKLQRLDIRDLPDDDLTVIYDGKQMAASRTASGIVLQETVTIYADQALEISV